MQIVTSGPFAGAVMMTFLTEPRMCFWASSFLRNSPVPSMTMSAPTSGQGICPGSRSAKTRTLSPLIVMESPETLISPAKWP